MADHKYSSRVIYDIDRTKHLETKNIEARSVSITSSDTEKLEVVLWSNEISTLEKDYKVKISDTRWSCEVSVARSRAIAEETALADLYVEIVLPKSLISDAEFKIHTDELDIHDAGCSNMEFGGIARRVTLKDVKSKLELDIKADMNIRVEGITGNLDINQISCSSTLEVPEGFGFRTEVKGSGNVIRYENEDISRDDAPITVELNGRKSVLNIRQI